MKITKLSECLNSRTNKPITEDQISAMAMKFGISWKGKGYSENNPSLSPVMIQAIEEIGLDHPKKLMERAFQLQEQDQEQRDIESKKSFGRVYWYNYSVWIDGQSSSLHYGMSSLVVNILKSNGYKLSGDLHHGHSGHDVSDEILLHIEQEIAKTSKKITDSVNNSHTQLWQDCESCGKQPSYQNSKGIFCKNCT